MRVPRPIIGVVTLFVLGALSAPANAHPSEDAVHQHPDSQSATEHSRNAKHLANIPRSSAATQSDLAFQGRLAFAGNYNGFRVIDTSKPESPKVVRDVWCPGAQNDISIWGDAIVLSVDAVQAGPSCAAGPANPPTLETGWEGVRVFSLAKVLAKAPDADGFTRLEPEANVYTDCGSHTHTGIPQRGRVLVYVSSYPLRSGPSCGPHDDPTDTHDPLHRKISIVEVPLANLAGSRVLKTVPVDVPTWEIGLPGFNPMQGCHDIQVFPRVNLAAAACASVGQLWDISNPANPKTLRPLWQVDEPEVEFYHSAAFTQDARVVVFGDESVHRNCDDGSGSGQLWFYDRRSGERLGSFQIPRDQGGAYCSAHLFTVLHTAHGYKLVSAWYSGGVTVVQFTNPARAKEIAYYDPPPIAATDRGLWAAYAYNGYVYTNGLVRGFDSFFIAPARGETKKLPRLNPQTQE